MKVVLLLTAWLAAWLSACAQPQVPPAMPPPPVVNKVTEHIKIEDSFIDKDDYFAIIEPVWWSVSIYDGEKVYEENLKRFSREQRYVFAIAWHVAEVNNGGHDQFYSNSTGIVWRDALAGYKAVGLNEAADILQQSANMLGGNPSLDRATRENELSERVRTLTSLINGSSSCKKPPISKKRY